MTNTTYEYVTKLSLPCDVYIGHVLLAMFCLSILLYLALFEGETLLGDNGVQEKETMATFTFPTCSLYIFPLGCTQCDCSHVQTLHFPGFSPVFLWEECLGVRELTDTIFGWARV